MRPQQAHRVEQTVVNALAVRREHVSRKGSTEVSQVSARDKRGRGRLLERPGRNAIRLSGRLWPFPVDLVEHRSSEARKAKVKLRVHASLFCAFVEMSADRTAWPNTLYRRVSQCPGGC